jgi:hypothetical protein
MEEFFRAYYGFVTYSVEFLAALTGILLYKKYKFTAAKYLVFFLVFAFLLDLFGNYPQYFKDFGYFYLIKGTLVEKNYWWYNVLWFFGLVSFIYYLNYKIIEKIQYKLILKYGFLIYLLLFFSYSIFNFEYLISSVNMFLSILSLWMVFVAISIYYIQILQSNAILNFYRSIYFYINTAILMWNLIFVPTVFYEIYFSEADWTFVILKWQILLFINICFYLTLILALIFCKPEVK